jgi:hypothetical protein
VIGRAYPKFWKHFDALPLSIQKLAREKYGLGSLTLSTHHCDLKSGGTASVSFG